MDFIAALASRVVESIPMVLPFIQAAARQPLQHPPEHLLVRRPADQPARSRNRHVIRRWLVQSYVQKLPQGQRVGHPPGNASFAVDAFKKSRSSSSGNRYPEPATA